MSFDKGCPKHRACEFDERNDDGCSCNDYHRHSHGLTHKEFSHIAPRVPRVSINDQTDTNLLVTRTQLSVCIYIR